METMHLDIAKISFFGGTTFWGTTWVPMSNSIHMETCPGAAR